MQSFEDFADLSSMYGQQRRCPEYETEKKLLLLPGEVVPESY